jgi:hypothetical protein
LLQGEGFFRNARYIWGADVSILMPLDLLSSAPLFTALELPAASLERMLDALTTPIYQKTVRR